MGKNDKYTCGRCGEEDYGKYPYCKCEREYDKEVKELARKLIDATFVAYKVKKEDS